MTVDRALGLNCNMHFIILMIEMRVEGKVLAERSGDCSYIASSGMYITVY